MVSINKSFLYGVGFASLTWIISFYLYTQLSTSISANSARFFVPHSESTNHPSESSKYMNKYWDKSYYKKNKGGSSFNSNSLVEKLRPIQVGPSESNKLDEGI